MEAPMESIKDLQKRVAVLEEQVQKQPQAINNFTTIAKEDVTVTAPKHSRKELNIPSINKISGDIRLILKFENLSINQSIIVLQKTIDSLGDIRPWDE